MLHGEGQLHTWVCTVCWWEISGYVIAIASGSRGLMCRYNVDMKDDRVCMLVGDVPYWWEISAGYLGICWWETSGYVCIYASGRPLCMYVSGRSLCMYVSGRPLGMYVSGRPLGMYVSGRPLCMYVVC